MLQMYIQETSAATLNGTYFQAVKATYTFGRTMDGSTLTGATVQIREQGQTVGVAANVTFDTASSTLTIAPTSDLKDGTSYTYGLID